MVSLKIPFRCHFWLTLTIPIIFVVYGIILKDYSPFLGWCFYLPFQIIHEQAHKREAISVGLRTLSRKKVSYRNSSPLFFRGVSYSPIGGLTHINSISKKTPKEKYKILVAGLKANSYPMILIIFVLFVAFLLGSWGTLLGKTLVWLLMFVSLSFASTFLGDGDLNRLGKYL